MLSGMAIEAKTLQPPGPEFIPIARMVHNVIGDPGHHDLAGRLAQHAQRLNRELMAGASPPDLQVIPISRRKALGIESLRWHRYCSSTAANSSGV